MGELNTVPMRINRAEGAAGQVKISGGAGVLETWGAPAPAAHVHAAGDVTSGQFPLARMPRAAAGQFLEGNGAANPIYNALIAGDIPNLDVAKITSGTFGVGRGGTGLNAIAIGGILYTAVANVLSRIAPGAANQVLRSTAANALQFAALLAADIPNLDASKITTGQIPLARLVGAVCSETEAGTIADGKITTHGTGAKHRWTDEKLLKGAGAAANPDEIDVPAGPWYGYLSAALFQTVPATGTFNDPAYLNDGSEGSYAYEDAVDQYLEVILPIVAHITQWRQFGNTNNNGAGKFKLQYKDVDGNWQDWVTNISFRTTEDWSAWDSSGGDVIASAIKVVCTTDDGGYGAINELEVKY